MKRFMLFEYAEYYPSGGMADFTESFDTAEEAVASIDPVGRGGAHVYDSVEHCLVHIWSSNELFQNLIISDYSAELLTESLLKQFPKRWVR